VNDGDITESSAQAGCIKPSLIAGRSDVWALRHD
jgi:hypothetical protein